MGVGWGEGGGGGGGVIGGLIERIKRGSNGSKMKKKSFFLGVASFAGK